ncbi:DinB family protein [Persicitalea sp.]|uniref:DinB family protein n=1 Tax=Persicitalea sp. TaxID=3100273 RepID=UPI003593D64C
MKNQTLEEWAEPLAKIIESHLEKATSTYQNLSEDVLNARPADGGWSAAGCIAHLNTYSDFYLPKTRRALGQVVAEQGGGTFRSGTLGKLLTNTIKPENKLKLKAFKAHRPPEDLDGVAVIAQFIEYQEQWLRLLHEIEGGNQLDARVQSSITPLIRFKLGDVFAFMKAHDERHLQQADRVLGSLMEKV